MEGMEIQQWLQSLLDSMTCSGVAVTYTLMNIFTMHNFILAMGPAGFLASFLNMHLYILPQAHVPSLPGVVYPGLLAWEGVVALSRKREERRAAVDPWCERGEHVPKVPHPPPPMDLRLKDREG